MPKSKKPRKKGAHGREQAARSRLLRNQFKDPAECRRLVKIVEDARAARHKGSAQLGYLFALADQDFMVERFIEAFMALERWQTTEGYILTQASICSETYESPHAVTFFNFVTS